MGYTRAARPRGLPTDSATETQTARLQRQSMTAGAVRVRVKRWGKSPPLQAQARRHGKPHRVQGQIGDRGAARSTFRASGTGSGYWLLRQMVLSVPQGMQTEFGLQPFQNHFPRPLC